MIQLGMTHNADSFSFSSKAVVKERVIKSNIYDIVLFMKVVSILDSNIFHTKLTNVEYTKKTKKYLTWL
ncbi:hypothetical protein FACS1894184_03670 [Clostridia bacterium]|nr:hypothetical protein FACS1894184_03670 [Clostridia bacterium]